MKPLRKIMANPSGWDSLENYAGDVPKSKWLCVMTRNRDSDILTESNWDAAIAALGGESDSVQIFRFGHWACGWWEALAVTDGSPEHTKAKELHERLQNYPVLDEDDFSDREHNEANRVWAECYSAPERIAYMRKFRDHFDFHNFVDLLGCVRGKYFAGYDSELIN